MPELGVGQFATWQWILARSSRTSILIQIAGSSRQRNLIALAALPFDMPKFKVEFSNNTTIVPERELDFPNLEAACKGAREIANKLRADGMLTFGFSDWQMTIMNADGKTVAVFPLEEHDNT